jgi:hypothetical protein
MGMLIKIKGTNQERFGETVISVMNLACVCFRRGNIPTEEDMLEPKITGLSIGMKIRKKTSLNYYRQQTITRHLLESRGENFIVIEFYSRYDIDNKEVNALSNLVLSFFADDEVEKVKDYYVPKNKM